MENDIELFNGEVILREDGMYTKIHFYSHPGRDLELILIGDTHGGTLGYHDTMRYWLNQCNVVYHEGRGPMKAKEEPPFPSLDEVKELSNQDVTECFLLSQQLFFLSFKKLEGIISTNSETMITKGMEHKWIEVDPLGDEETAEKIMKGVYDQFESANEQQKKTVTDYLLDKVQKMQEGTFEFKEFGEVLSLLYGEGGIGNLLVKSPLATARDPPIIREVLMKVDSDKSIKKAGLLYGAAHMVGMRPLIEKASYVCQKSEEIRAIQY